jgi:hypothetical protein
MSLLIEEKVLLIHHLFLCHIRGQDLTSHLGFDLAWAHIVSIIIGQLHFNGAKKALAKKSHTAFYRKSSLVYYWRADGYRCRR